MKEVEILVKVFENKDKILKTLNQFHFTGKNKVLDIYYCIPQKQSKNEWFRLRKKNNKFYIAYKKDIFEKGKWIYSEEEETEVKAFKTMQKIISNLGFKELIRINNLKHTFETKDYEIVFEEVKDLGLFLEVEKLNVKDNEDIKKIKTEIQIFINRLKLKTSKELNKGKPELMISRASR